MNVGFPRTLKCLLVAASWRLANLSSWRALDFGGRFQDGSVRPEFGTILCDLEHVSTAVLVSQRQRGARARAGLIAAS